MNVVLGLGNPGMTYHRTRHNAGFNVIEQVARRHAVQVRNILLDPGDDRPACVYGDFQAGGAAVRLAMPLTMMNESGRALHALRADAKALLIVCDDVNLPLGTLRFRPSGGPGGHHGLASCLDVLGTDDVARLRLGVGIDPLPKDLREFVLSPYRPEERPVVEAMYAQAADACEVWIQEGLNAAMNRYNTAREA